MRDNIYDAVKDRFLKHRLLHARGIESHGIDDGHVGIMHLSRRKHALIHAWCHKVVRIYEAYECPSGPGSAKVTGIRKPAVLLAEIAEFVMSICI